MGLLSDFFGSVTVIPEATVRSGRMALLYYFLLLSITVYIILELVFFHRYADFTPSSSFINLWTVSGRTKAGEHLNETYCHNASYNWNLTNEQVAIVGPFKMVDVPCKWYTDAQLLKVEHNRISLATTVLESTESSPVPEPYFATGQDKIKIKFLHNLRLPDGVELRNPPTEIIDHKGNVFMSEKQTAELAHISLTIKDIFKILGKDLDAWNPQQLNDFGIPPIRHRNSGMVVAIRLRYTNTEDMKAGIRPKCRITMSSSEGQWGNMGTVAHNDVTLSRMGLTMNFLIEGELASVTPYRIVLHFVSGFVLIGIARTIVLTSIKCVKCCSADEREFSELNEIEITSAAYKDEHHLNAKGEDATSCGPTTSSSSPPPAGGTVLVAPAGGVSNPLQKKGTNFDKDSRNTAQPPTIEIASTFEDVAAVHSTSIHALRLLNPHLDDVESSAMLKLPIQQQLPLDSQNVEGGGHPTRTQVAELENAQQAAKSSDEDTVEEISA